MTSILVKKIRKEWIFLRVTKKNIILKNIKEYRCLYDTLIWFKICLWMQFVFMVERAILAVTFIYFGARCAFIFELKRRLPILVSFLIMHFHLHGKSLCNLGADSCCCGHKFRHYGFNSCSLIQVNFVIKNKIWVIMKSPPVVPYFLRS